MFFRNKNHTLRYERGRGGGWLVGAHGLLFGMYVTVKR